jgi:hypothetical protein
LIRLRHSNPAPSNGDDGTGNQICGVVLQDLGHQPDAGLSRNVRKANQAAVAAALKEDQIAKVLVHGDEDSLLGSGPDKDRGISGIRTAVLGFHDVMSQRP